MGLIKMISNAIKSNQIPPEKHFRNDVEKDMYINNVLGYRDKKDRLDYQNALLDSVNKANEQFTIDGDLNKIIKVYEDAFVNANPPCVSSQRFNLADLYIKNGENDKAWGFLNMLISRGDERIDKIRSQQARILKKEKKHAYAVKMISAEYLATSNIIPQDNYFQRDKYLKDIGVCFRALKWDEVLKDGLADIVYKQILSKDYDDKKLFDSIQSYYEAHDLKEV